MQAVKVKIPPLQVSLLLPPLPRVEVQVFLPQRRMLASQPQSFRRIQDLHLHLCVVFG